LALILGLGTPAAARAAPPDAGPLPWRVGGRVGFTVDAAAFPDSAGPTLDVYVRIPPGTLAALARDTLGQARLRLTVRLRSAFGGARGQEQVQEFPVEPADSVAGFGKVVALRFPIREVDQRLAVRLEDVFSRKRGLAYTGRQVTESGRIEGELRAFTGRPGRELSDPEFVWAAQSGGPPSAFERGGRTLLPDPERLYGLLAPRLQAAFVARTDAARPWTWTARVLDAAGKPVAARESTAVASERLDGGVELDVSGLAAGGYDLELVVGQTGDEQPPLVRRGHFSVAWQPEAWLRNPRDIEDDVHFLLSADQEEAFAALAPGEQERYLADFWLARDPTPLTVENEARSSFLGRVARANQLYTHPGLGKGMFSDMGRVFIRYGEPSEVVNEVIPTGDQTVDLVISQIMANEDRSIGDVNAKGPGGDLRPYEMWIYDGPIGLPPDADPKAGGHPRHKRLVFLFVDERGAGDYRLRYSTE
jgi:GWxTD domain-containing protein